MDQKQDYREKYEKIKLHIVYLIIIAVILAVIGFSLAFGKNSIALGQISMASTVSSIILSSIAIFMSISGESKLNHTHDKLVETSDRMSGIADNIEQANNLLNDTINQITKIDYISELLEQIGQSVDIVEKEVLNKSFSLNENSDVGISKDILWEIYTEMIDGDNDIGTIITRGVMEYLIVSHLENTDIEWTALRKYLASEMGECSTFAIGLAWGILGVFIFMGVTDDEAVLYFKEKMALSDAKLNKIKEFL